MKTSLVAWLRNSISSRTAHSSVRHPRRRKAPARTTRNGWLAAEVQLLEVRALLSGSSAAHVAMVDLVRFQSGAVVPNASSTQSPPGYSPAQIKQAYGFNQISFNGIAGDGSGTTIAIIDAYDDPNIAGDLHQFDLAFGLPDPPSFTKVNQYGGTSNLPAPDAGWITEIALDVEWAHAMAPAAKILLVEANSAYDSDLMIAVNTARNYAGVNVVSMSYGGGEYFGEKADDIYFTTPAGHAGVTFVASSGDSGAPISSPASSPNVVSVGGTTLSLSANGTWMSETGWSGSGGGISAYETQPAYQKGIVTQTTTFRANPDVAYDANPNSGFGVYDSYNNGTANPWGQWGGTSDAAPQWAALIAIADQGRALAGKGSLDGGTQTLPLLYGMSASNFHDITSGTSTGSPHYSAGPGYDLVTGRGSPYANLVVNDLVGSTPTPVSLAPTLTSISTLATAFQQVPFNIGYATLLGASNAQDFNGAPIQFRINSVQNGTLTITHTGVTTAVVAGSTLFGSGDTLTWTGAAGVSGSAVNAFAVTAFDGTQSSSPTAQVAINVQSLGTAFSLSGPWIVASAAGVAQGLGQITQSGASLTFVNSNGVSSTGQYTSQTQVVASNFDGQASVTGTIDTTTADNGRIVFADGTAWLRVSLGGQYAVTGPGITSPTLASITQNGARLTLVNGSTANSATVSSATQILVSTGSNTTSAATYADGKISFSNNGQIWTKLDLPANYTNLAGVATQVTQNGASLRFVVTSTGETSPGYWISPTQVYATAFAQTGTVGSGKIVWSGGNVWTENVVVNGSVLPAGASTNSGAVSIAASQYLSITDYTNLIGDATHVFQNGGTLTFVVDSSGETSTGYWISPTQVYATDFGQVGTVGSTGSINWSSGQVWTATPSSLPAVTTNYTNLGGATTHVIRNGPWLTFVVDSSGERSFGYWIGPAQIYATAFGQVGTVGAGKITWSGGNVWSGSTTITPSTTLSIALTSSIGVVSRAQLTGATSLIGLDGALAGLTATRQNGNLVWSNGDVWNDFDFNALNALFAMGNGAT